MGAGSKSLEFTENENYESVLFPYNNDVHGKRYTLILQAFY